MAEIAAESEATYTVSDSDLLRVLVALAGRIACPPERLIQVVGPYAEAYNLCTGELTLAAIARSTGVDKSNLRKAMLRWEEAGVLFRLGPEARPFHLYSLPTQNERDRSKRREGNKTLASAEPFNGDVDG
jgi:hypothetical protein